jgi:hypothetical protein
MYVSYTLLNSDHVLLDAILLQKHFQYSLVLVLNALVSQITETLDVEWL